jgi:3-hydroxyacyl-CoA dehydrogenase/enoyl-CoA hydratase/carnithine racemase
MNNREFENFTVSCDDRGVVRISLDVPGRPLNILNPSVMAELNQIVEDLEQNPAAKVAVIESGKASGFLAGADVNEIVAIESPDRAMRLLEDGQSLFQKIESLKIPTVAVIHGPCLGGGLELCLACDYRIARDDGSTKIGLPEISLGLIPGWGGTQRLPKLVGLTNSLEMILKGKTVGARDALQMGLIHRAIEANDWDEGVDQFTRNLMQGSNVPIPERQGWVNRCLEGNPIGRKLILRITGKKIASKAKIYPALKSAVNAIASGYQRGVDGFEVERKEFAELLSTPTCRSLISLFFARETARNVKTWSPEIDSQPQAAIHRVGVVGAGAMGAGIAQLAALRGCDVVVKEIDQNAADAGRKRIEGMVSKFAKRKGWSEGKRQSFIDSVNITCDEAALADSDLVVEAIVERLDVKQSLFKNLDSIVEPTAILATNTSSLSVDAMADATSRPGKFGGLHFFNPVHRMELVEVVRGKKTSAETVARLVSFVRTLGKTPIVTSDSPGFLVNRVLFPYLGEAVLMVREGIDVATIDKELRRFGMPMGPLELLDQVGLDVAQHVASSLTSILRGLEPVPEMLSEMVGNGQLGKKSNAGFYQYSKGKKGKPSSSGVAPVAPVPHGEFADDGLTEIQRRLVYPMLMESIRCLEEQVVDQPWAIDLAMVLGTGFAPHRGGPLHVVDQIGTDVLLSNAKQMSELFGARFSSPAQLIQMAEANSKYFDANQAKKKKDKVVSH